MYERGHTAHSIFHFFIDGGVALVSDIFQIINEASLSQKGVAGVVLDVYGLAGVGSNIGTTCSRVSPAHSRRLQ